MTRSRQTTMNISNALRTIDKSIVPDGCVTEVYYDKIGRLWYAQFLSVDGCQYGWLGSGFSPLEAVQSLMHLNKPVPKLSAANSTKYYDDPYQ